MSIDNVLDNFCWRVESVSPTNQIVRNKFLRFDPNQNEPTQSSAWYRRFWVEWNGSDPDKDSSSPIQRLAWHDIQVHIVYPILLDVLDLQKLILADRHDLIKTLRAPANRVGYNDTNPTDNVGLYARIRNGDELLKNQYDDLWELIIAFRTQILESEI